MSITRYQMGVPVLPKKQRGHTTPKAPLISLNQPGRGGVSNLLGLRWGCHTTVYARLAGHAYPQPDGYDGKFPYWKTSSIAVFLEC
jgi:hypothetical protein